MTDDGSAKADDWHVITDDWSAKADDGRAKADGGFANADEWCCNGDGGFAKGQKKLRTKAVGEPMSGVIVMRMNY